MYSFPGSVCNSSAVTVYRIAGYARFTLNQHAPSTVKSNLRLQVPKAIAGAAGVNQPRDLGTSTLPMLRI